MRLTRISTRPVLHAVAALAVAAVLVGPSAHAATPTRPVRAPAVTSGHVAPHHPVQDFMMGPHCGASSLM